MKILILADKQASTLASDVPNARVWSPTEAQQSNVQRLRIEIYQSLTQGFRELLVEEQPHHSSRGDADGALFTLGRVGQASPDVIARELGKVCQQLLL